MDAAAVQLRPERYRLLKVAPAAARAVTARLAHPVGPFLMMIREPDALSLLLAEDDVRALGDLLADRTEEPQPYRVITFATTLPWDLVGFLAEVLAVLANAGIPLGAISAYDRDHLFVREELADRATGLLQDAARDGRLG